MDVSFTSIAVVAAVALAAPLTIGLTGLRLPAIVVEILLGIVVGPQVLGWAKVDEPGGFVLPHPPRDSRTFTTDKDRAIFTVSPTEVLHVQDGRLLLQTMRSHDQFNTTIYGLEDRYRGIHGTREVVFVNPDDLAELGLQDGTYVDIVSERTAAENHDRFARGHGAA